MAGAIAESGTAPGVIAKVAQSDNKVGRPVSRAEALEIARKAMDDAERARKALALLDSWRAEAASHEPRECVELVCANAGKLSPEAVDALMVAEWWLADRFPWLDVRLRMGDE